MEQTNPLLFLQDEAAFASLGSEFYEPVEPATFPRHVLRFRNDDLLKKLGLDPEQIRDTHVVEAFGQWRGDRPRIALCYHGYQFGGYNPYLGDGRGFLYGQFRGSDGQLYDLGTKGSGPTPFSRGGDGRLTLKGGIREVLAGEALHRLGVRTSRCLSLIETGESLWRGDEASPTRSSVMVRMSHTHIRFGTLERLSYLKRPDLIRRLLDHVIHLYYPDLRERADPYLHFFQALVQRTAEMVAQWMSVGFCHGVLNTDNMSIVGESFDYGPYGFISAYDPQFTAAYFDYWGYYRFGNQPEICRVNLERLCDALESVIPSTDLLAALAQFNGEYRRAYTQRMMQKLGFDPDRIRDPEELLELTLRLMIVSQIDYHEFFTTLTRSFSPNWCYGRDPILQETWTTLSQEGSECMEQWCAVYHHHLVQHSQEELISMLNRLQHHNPPFTLLRPVIESVWHPIATTDEWEPFYRLLEQIQRGTWTSDVEPGFP